MLDFESQRESEIVYIRISGSGLYTVITEEIVIIYISSMGNNMILYPTAIGENDTNFPYNHLDFCTKNEKVVKAHCCVQQVVLIFMIRVDQNVEKFRLLK